MRNKRKHQLVSSFKTIINYCSKHTRWLGCQMCLVFKKKIVIIPNNISHCIDIYKPVDAIDLENKIKVQMGLLLSFICTYDVHNWFHFEADSLLSYYLFIKLLYLKEMFFTWSYLFLWHTYSYRQASREICLNVCIHLQ